jgi:polyhydroxybutyrate depolymerase
VLTVGASQREAIVYVPARLPAAKVPAILMLHGNGGTATGVRSVGFREEADRLGFVAVFPDGTKRPNEQCCSWNDGRPLWGTQEPPDDVQFFSGLLDLLLAKYPVDPNRVYLTGWSNGAFMSYRLVCELSERIAAIAAVGGTRDNSACAIPRPVPVLHMHGAADPTEPYQGGKDARGLEVPAVSEVISFWKTHNGCQGEAAVSMLTPKVEQRRYASCQSESAVVQITVQGGGHCWWGAGCGAGMPGDPEFKATPPIVQFLLAHSRVAIP